MTVTSKRGRQLFQEKNRRDTLSCCPGWHQH